MSELSREARAILEAASGADDPGIADKQRVHEAVMAAVGSTPPIPSGASATAATTAGLGLKLVLGLVAVVGLSVGGYLLATRDSDPPTPELATAPPAESETAAAPTQPGVAPAMPEAPPQELPARESPATGVPSPAPVADRPPPRRKPASRRDQRSDLETLLAEKKLIGAARRALAGDDARVAMEALDRHADEFPRGQLRAEREGTRVLALCAAGRRDAAVAQAGKFLRRHANHPMAARVRASCAFSD